METIVTLGPERTYSDQAAQLILSGSNRRDLKVDYVSRREDILGALGTSGVYGVVMPFQNKILGDVASHYIEPILMKLLEIGNTSQLIRGSVNIPINFASFGNQNSNIVCVHPVAKGQCIDYITENELKIYESDSNVKAIRDAKDQNSLGIADANVLKEMGIPILSYDVQKERDNQTRFLYIGKELQSSELNGDTGAEYYGESRVYFVPTENKVGSLLRIMQGLWEQEINAREVIARESNLARSTLDQDGVILVLDNWINYCENSLEDVMYLGSYSSQWN